MSGHSGDGLHVDADIRRGEFTLTVDLVAAPGQVVGVLGPNGAGKSTLLAALAGLIPVADGRITLAGQVFDDAGTGAFVEAAGRPVGFVFQNYRLFPHLSVLDNVAFGPRARGAGRSAATAVADEWLARLGLTELAHRKPKNISGGQAQRVALARALAARPSLLLLDEPLSALDAGTRLDVRAELKRHLSDFPGPCLLVTHDPLEALVLADRLVVLEGGRVAQEGTPASIARRPRTEYVAKLVGLNLYSGRVDGSVVDLAGGGRFVTAGHAERGEVLVALRPSDVRVSGGPSGTDGALNAWPALVTGITLLGDRIRLDLDGAPRAQVDLTPAAVLELALSPGSEVWLSVEPADLEVYAAPATDRPTQAERQPRSERPRSERR